MLIVFPLQVRDRLSGSLSSEPVYLRNVADKRNHFDAVQGNLIHRFRLPGTGTVVLFTDAEAGAKFLQSRVMVQLRLHEPSISQSKSAGTSRSRVFEISYVPVVAVLIAVVLGLGFNSAYGRRLSDQAQGTAQEKGAGYPNWTAVIGELRQRGTLPSETNILADASDSGAVWLRSINNDGESVAIDGMATTPNAVSKIISDLKSTGYFSNIEIKETYRDDSTNKNHSFEFQLTCEFETDKS